ncbi:MAG: anaerobic ribonucleoside-triphosphate reductase activating protein [Erysipelotrichaceae bacterium]|nr:anaerobic ribonucleoside-triphosphate reductase activating protein [Erysipelotrichaceae bacterium]
MSEEKYLSLDSSILYRCNQKYFDKRLAKYEIGYTQLILLAQIYENEGISMNELAVSGVFDKGTITKAIQKLEQLGYVKIVASEVDKRFKSLYTTETSQEFMPELYRIRSKWNAYLSEGLSTEDMDAYYLAMNKFIAKAREYSKIEFDKENIDVKFYGLQKLTLLDFPGNMATTIFTGGCNFRCPFCHNRSLVFLNENDQEISSQDVIDYLSSRSRVLDGVCITGGEPLLHKDIINFIRRVKDLGLKVKLDTNGTSPDTLISLVEEGLLDYVAVDIKNCKEKYALTVGLDNYDVSDVEKTVEYLLEGHVDYEFRTTVVDDFHKVEDIVNIGKWIKGASAYYLQNFEDHGTCICQGLQAVSKDTLYEMRDAVKEYVKKVEIRGVRD